MPELGKATYVLELNTAEFDAGLTSAEARATAATNGIAKSIGKADESVAALGPTSTKTAEQVSVAAGQMSMDFKEVGAAAVEAGGEAQTGATEIVAASEEAAAGSEAAAKKTANAWERAGSSLGSAGRRMRGAGREMTRMFTLPVAATLGVATAMTLKYTEKIRLLELQAGATAKETAHMHKAVLDFAKSGQSTQGPDKLADALFHIESVGFRGAKAMDVLKQATNGAMVGGANLEATTNALVGAMKTQIKGTETAASTMGTLNAAIGRGNLRMDDLTSALGTGLANAAKGAGISLADVLGGLDVLTQQGIPAQQAATKLAQSLATIQDPTGKAAKALKSLGLGHLDLANALRGPGGLPAMLDLLKSRLDSIKDPSQRAAIVLDIFSRRAGKTMLTLLNDTKGVHDAVDGIRKSAADFPDLVKKARLDDVNKLRIAWAQIQAALIQLGATVAPYVVKLAAAVVKVVEAFQKLPGGVKMAIVAGVALLAVLGPLISSIGFLAIGIAGLAPIIAGLGTAIAFLLTPVGLLVAALVALAAAAVAAEVAPKQLQKLFEKMGLSAHQAEIAVESLRLVFSALKESITLSLKVIATGVIGTFKVIIDSLKILKDLVTGDWSDLWKNLKDIFKTWVSGFLSDIKNFATAWTNIFNGLGDTLKTWALKTALAIVEPFSHLPSFLGGWARKAKNSLESQLAAIDQRKMQQAAKSLADNYGIVLEPAFGQIGAASANNFITGFTKQASGSNAVANLVGSITGVYTGPRAKNSPMAIWKAKRGAWVDEAGNVIADQAKAWEEARKKYGAKATMFNTHMRVPLPVSPTTPATTTPTIPTVPTVDTTGTGGGTGGKKKVFKEGDPLQGSTEWHKLQLRQTVAEGTKRLSDDVKVFNAEIDYLKKLRDQLAKHHHLTLAAKQAIASALNTARSDLENVNQKIKDAMSKLADIVLWTPQMEIRESLAERTTKTSDDKKVFEAELKYLKKLLKQQLDYLKQKKITMKEFLDNKVQIVQEITSVLAKLKDLKNQEANQSNQFASLYRSALTERSSFFSSFGPTIFRESSGDGGVTRTPGTGTSGPQGFAHGGIVRGYATGGLVDTVPAMLSPGELVLNRAQIAELGGALGTGPDPAAVWSAAQATTNIHGASKPSSKSVNVGTMHVVARLVQINASHLSRGGHGGGGTESGRASGRATGGLTDRGTSRAGRQRDWAPSLTDRGSSHLPQRQWAPSLTDRGSAKAVADRRSVSSINRPAGGGVTVNLNHLKEATVDKYREAKYAEIAFKHAFDGGDAAGG